MGRGSANPTHTPAQKLGVKPQNQALVLSLVVPVLPAPVPGEPAPAGAATRSLLEGGLQQVGHEVGFGRVEHLVLPDAGLLEDLAVEGLHAGDQVLVDPHAVIGEGGVGPTTSRSVTSPAPRNRAGTQASRGETQAAEVVAARVEAEVEVELGRGGVDRPAQARSAG